MDQDDQTESQDNKPAENAPVTSSVDGFVVNPSTSVKDNDQNDDEPAPATPPVVPAAKEPKDNSGLKAWLVIFIVLFIAAAAGLGYFYTKNSQNKTDLSNQKNSAASLQVQLNNVQKSSASSASQISNLKKANSSQSTYITSLVSTANQLKTTCGKSCSSITMPTAPTSD